MDECSRQAKASTLCVIFVNRSKPPVEWADKYHLRYRMTFMLLQLQIHVATTTAASVLRFEYVAHIRCDCIFCFEANIRHYNCIWHWIKSPECSGHHHACVFLPAWPLAAVVGGVVCGVYWSCSRVQAVSLVPLFCQNIVPVFSHSTWIQDLSFLCNGVVGMCWVYPDICVDVCVVYISDISYLWQRSRREILQLSNSDPKRRQLICLTICMCYLPDDLYVLHL